MALRLRGASSGYIELKAPASAGDNTLTLPTNNGTANTFLKTDGSGNLSWQSNLTFDGTKLDITTTGAGFRITRNSQYIELDGNFGNGGDQSLATSAGFRIQTGGVGNSYERLRITSTGNIETKGYDGECFKFNADWGNGARNIQIWNSDQSPWHSFVGTNLTYDGTNYIKPSDDASSNWGNIAGIVFNGSNVNQSSGNAAAISFVVDLPGENGLNYSLGTSKATAIDNKTVAYFTPNKNFVITDGDLVIGTGGHGIDFSAQTSTPQSGASADNERFDHYEEGDWTPEPTITHQGGSGSLSAIQDQFGRYVRSGNFIQVWFYFKFTAANITNCNVGLNGLPFTISNDAQWNSGFNGGIARRGVTGGEIYICEGMTKNGTQIGVLRKYNNTGFGDTTQSIGGTACYLVD